LPGAFHLRLSYLLASRPDALNSLAVVEVRKALRDEVSLRSSEVID